MCRRPATNTYEIAIVGAGAAGLTTAVFAARLMPARSVVVLEGSARPATKLLITGGGRCNITNRTVTATDFAGGNRNVIKRVLAAMPVDRTLAFFSKIGVEVEELEDGKLFPTTNRARTVLDALLAEADRLQVSIRTQHRVTDIAADGLDRGFAVSTGAETIHARHLALATGGQSYPQTGSDGSGYRLAQSLGHTLVTTTPALVPFLLDGDFHVPLSGITLEVELSVEAQGLKPARARGVMLWTHFGVSGPVVLDVSRHWHRARTEKSDVALHVNLLPGETATTAEKHLLDLVASRPRVQLDNALSRMIPARLADALLDALDIPGDIVMAHLPKTQRQKVASALVRWPLPVQDSRGYAHAEATAGGVPLAEVQAASLESRKCPGLYFCGEILDVDGRIGGFNLQWAWASAYVVAAAIARATAG